jgi:hypothetical protein
VKRLKNASLIKTILCFVVLAIQAIEFANSSAIAGTSITDKIDTDIELIRGCAEEFVLSNMDNEELRDFKLTTNSLKGEITKQSEGVWFFGDWVLEGYPDKPYLHFTRYYGKFDALMLVLNLAKTDNRYEVANWDVVNMTGIEKVK